MPLADMLRPESINDIIGQDHLLGPNGVVRKMVEKNSIKSMVLWGKAGIGKTTIAKCLANDTSSAFEILNATSAKVADVRKVAETAEKRKKSGTETILFIDEIHRFSKSQQDVLLPFVEDGTLILIGATTEKPVFAVNTPIISRCQVFELNILSDKELFKVIMRVFEYYKKCGKDLKLDKDAGLKLIRWSSGDARKLITTLETIIDLFLKDGSDRISIEDVDLAMPNKHIHFDKDGNEHYDMAQCWQTAVQNSDADSAIYWLAKWTLVEDPAFIARRILISAAEDAPLNPHAQTAAVAACLAVERCGLPEARINLAHATIEIAKTPRCRVSINAFDAAMDDIINGVEITALKADNSKHAKPDGYTKIDKTYVKGWKDRNL